MKGVFANYVSPLRKVCEIFSGIRVPLTQKHQWLVKKELTHVLLQLLTAFCLYFVFSTLSIC